MFVFVCVSLCLIGWGVGCKPDICQGDSDCSNGQSCLGGTCTTKADGGDGGIDQEAIIRPEETTTTKDAGPEPFRPDIIVNEVPPWEANWRDAQWTPPDALTDGQAPPTNGLRKAGETCNPGLTAKPQDRCGKDLRCAAPFGLPVGICRQTCAPDKDTCPSGTKCAPVTSFETGQVNGYVCGPTQPEGTNCSYGLPCEIGHHCARIGTSSNGVCRKACGTKAECGTGWCGSAKDLTGTSQSICVGLGTKSGDPCEYDTICSSGFVCEGLSPRRVCRASGCNAQNPCPPNETCATVLNTDGTFKYAACYPIVKVGAICDDDVRCEANSVCARFSTRPQYQQCVKDCTQDANACTANEQCKQVSQFRKGCLKTVKAGDNCDGAVACETGTKCLAAAPDQARFCMTTCASNANACTGNTTCQTLTIDGTAEKLCLATCDLTKNTPCTNTQERCTSDTQAGVCIPDSTKWNGTRKQGESCRTYPGAPAETRCAAGLSCLLFKEGYRCAQPCDPDATSPCITGQSCLLDPQTQQHLCGTAGQQGNACDASAAALCPSPLACRDSYTSSKGTCEPTSSSPLGASCIPNVLPCPRPLRCAGDASLPFRWTCRQSCSSSTPCPNNGVCLSVIGGMACFEPCGANDTCQTAGYRCLDINGQKACL